MTSDLDHIRHLTEAGRLQDALIACMAILNVTPGHLGALNQAAKILLQGGAYADALKAIERIIALAPDAIAPMGQRAQACLALGHKAEAARVFIGLSRRAALDAASLVFLAQGLAQADDADHASILFTRAFHLSPQSAAGLSAANQAAGLAYRLGHLDQAAAIFEDALVYHPDRAEFHHNLAVVRFEQIAMIPAARAASTALALEPGYGEALSTLGQALFRHGIWPAATRILRRATAINPDDVRAHLGIYYLAEAQGDHDLARHHQAQALARQQVFSEPCSNPNAPSILILEAPGDFQANLPLGFVLSNADYHLHRYVLTDEHPMRGPDALPAYDLVFNAISEPDRTKDHLIQAARFVDAQSKPFINHPARVATTSRDVMALVLSGIDDLVVPSAKRTTRAALLDFARTGVALAPNLNFPLLVRPVGTHAGHDLEKIETGGQLTDYVGALGVDDFYVTAFVDYSNARDGLFRKFRAIVIDGEPHAFHMAIRDHWMVHYYNAHMELSAERRAEEEAYLADMHKVIGARAMEALRAIARLVQIDWFGVDFGLTPDGQVVLFEVDVAAIVHLMDDKETYGYKHRYVPKLITAAHDMIKRRLKL